MADHFPELDDDFGAPAGGGGALMDAGDFVGRFPSLDGGDDLTAPAAAAPPSRSGPTLEDDDDDFMGGFRSSSAAPAATAAAAPQPGADFVGGFARDPAPPATAPAPAPAHDEVSAFTSQFPELPSAPAPQTNGFGYGASPYAEAPRQAPAPSAPAQPTEPESDAVRAWREKQREVIRERDEASKAKHDQMIAKAEQAIDDFYASYSAKKERQIAKNKEEEAAFKAAQTDALAKGTTWERVASAVDLQDSRSKTSTRSTRDLGRMKELLLTLKRDADTAPGASGA